MAGTAARKIRTNTRCVRIVIIVAALTAAFFLWKIHDLKARNQDLIAAKSAVEQRISEELSRSEELAADEEQVLDEDTVIKIAREKYGLVFPDEIVFLPEE